VQQQLGRISSRTIPRNLYKRLKQGQALVLVDGYDDLPELEREPYLEWLTALMSEYSNNFYIVTGPATGYGRLTYKLGLTPIFLRPWSDHDMERAVDNWAEAWPTITGSKRSPGTKPTNEVIANTKASNRTLSPLELTLKIMHLFGSGGETGSIEDTLRTFVSKHMPSDQEFDLTMLQLAQAASLQLEEGTITLSHLRQMMGGTTQSSEPSPLSEEAEPPDKSKERKAEADPYAKLIASLHRSGLLIQCYGERYQFRHPVLAWYLASLTLNDMSDDALVEKTASASWSETIPFIAMHRPIDTIVKARMNTTPDVMQNHVFEVAKWLRYVNADAEWRMSYLLYLSNILLVPNQYPLLRERVAAALVATCDQAAIPTFRQAMKSAIPHLRILACLGLGAMGQPETLPEVIPLLHDPDTNVQIAAALALGTTPTEDLLTALLEAFTEGSEQLRQAVAETFANIPEEGHPILRDAIEDEDMMVRRAAVFGLNRIKSGWAILAIYRAFLEDKQWYVRSAAQLAYEEIQYRDSKGPKGYPSPEAIAWLNEWAAQQGENIEVAEEATNMLAKALRDKNAQVRILAATDLGQLGAAHMSPVLYTALRDQKGEVRDAVYRALAELQTQIGKSLPAPV
jgi:HEAT repeat protein